MNWFMRRALSVALVTSGLVSCAEDVEPGAEREPSIAKTEQALSRCGAVPRRPWPAGCSYSCVCSGPVGGPYGEDPGDYSCTGFPNETINGRPGGECRLRARGDCAFELSCEGD